MSAWGYFQHSQIKFVSPRGHVISSISYIFHKIQFVTQGTYSNERVETQQDNKPKKKGDKGSKTVILSVTDKLQEGLVQLNNRDHYLPLENQLEIHLEV